jgi:hypothetical protein
MENVMTECEWTSKCSFFNDQMENMPVTANVIKMKYCRANNTACARYMAYKMLGRDNVPADLTPNQPERILELL